MIFRQSFVYPTVLVIKKFDNSRGKYEHKREEEAREIVGLKPETREIFEATVISTGNIHGAVPHFSHRTGCVFQPHRLVAEASRV